MTFFSRIRLGLLCCILPLIASQSIAQLCPSLDELERREADVRLQWELAVQSKETDALVRSIGRLVVAAGELSEYVTYDSAFDAALEAYNFNVMYLYSNQSRNGAIITAVSLLDDYHRRLLERVLGYGGAICELEASVSPQNGKPAESSARTDRVSSGRTLGSVGNYTAIAGVIIAATIGLFFVYRSAENRSLSRVRFMCSYPVEATDDLGSQNLRMLDISAVGAKLRLNENRPFKGESTLKIGNKTIPIKIAWSNSHYAGVVFKHNLSARRVKMISDGIVQRNSKSSDSAKRNQAG